VKISVRTLKTAMTETNQPQKRTSRRRDTNLILRPFLKWAGGKRQLLPVLRRYIPKSYKTYFEPFIGAGALLFDLQPKRAIINDTNEELINCYQVIKDSPKELLEITKIHQKNNSKDYYYTLRELDRDSHKSIFDNLSNIEKAARIIYLNKTCFNGLFRVNSQGQFNVPYGDNKNPVIAEDNVIIEISKYLNENKVKILNKDFSKAVSSAKSGDFIYFDPPYDPVSDSSSFTGYDLHGFDKDKQTSLRDLCNELVDKGCQVLISNSSTDFIRNLYGKEDHYIIEDVQASRHINSVGTSRGKINELLIFSKYVR
jgi:DNA adenine methylase